MTLFLAACGNDAPVPSDGAALSAVDFLRREIKLPLYESINRLRVDAGLRPLGRHVGITRQERAYALELAAGHEFNHDGFEGRFENAEPVPAENNGPTDDGFTGWACENLVWVSPRDTPREVADAMLQLWLDSPPHRDCLFDEHMNAVGMGLAVAGDGRWFGGFLAVDDRTRPDPEIY